MSNHGQWEALIVGIDRYPSQTTLFYLTSGEKDGEDLSRRLDRYGYETFRIQRLPENPNQKGEEKLTGTGLVCSEDLKYKITNLFNPPASDPIAETALFFFSGHGWRKVVDGKEDVFLVTSDAYPDGNIYGVSISWLGEQIQQSKVKKVIVWLDCCYSGELLKYIPEDKDYCLITATRSHEFAKEITHQQGLLTEVLLQGLNPENDADGWVDSHKLGTHIEKAMRTTSQRPLIANSPRNILLTKRNTLMNFRDECPYRSLSYFQEIPEDATVFYGRKQITERLLERIEKDRVLAILGASGSGKSSLLRAGLLYELKLGQKILGSHLWTYLTPFSPTENPLQQLHNVGWVEDTKPNSMKSTHPTLPGGEVGINEATKIIMIIDQFEECFTMCDEVTRTDFLRELVRLLQEHKNLYLIIGMRSDFRGRLREYPQFVQQINKPYINVEHLNSEEIEAAIIKPADLVGVQIGSGLKQQLINDVEDYPGSLPLLQYTLTQLWLETRKQGEKFLTLKTYQNLGGIEGTLEKRADAVFESLNKKEQAIAQRLFLELTQIGETFDTRRRIALQELVNQYHSWDDLDKVTEKLADKDNRLILREGKRQPTLPSQEEKAKGKSKFLLLMVKQITVYGLTGFFLQQPTNKHDDSDIIIDVVHEALIRNWGRLRQWQDKYRSAMVIQRDIETAAKDWVNQGKPRDRGLLLQGTKLEKATDYLSKYRQLKMLNGMAKDYVEVSQQQDEMRRWRHRGVMVIIAVMGVVSVFFGMDSNKRATVATLREQAATVKNLLPIQPLEALLLSIATTGDNLNAWQVPRMLPEVRSSLYAAIDQVRERNSIEGHQDPVSSVAISSDGETIVSGSSDNTV
ncbi:MAG: caspase family protein, partial [Crocosphaera sp.]|nr:caspase family protein [Crocosphaera sp.]